MKRTMIGWVLVTGLTLVGRAGIKEQKDAFELAPPKVLDSAMLMFSGVEPAGARPYSTSLPFQWKGETYLFARVDDPGDPADSSAVLFKKVGKDKYDRVRDFPRFEIQDPYIYFIKGEIVMTGTKLVMSAGKWVQYSIAIYRDHGRGLRRLKHFTSSPIGHKDVRLVELKNGQIGVFTRPWPNIAYTTVRSLDELSINVIAGAKVIDGLYSGGWGGANGVTLLPDGKLLVAAHVSCHDRAKKRRLYSAAAFTFDPETRKASPCRIVATSRLYPFTGKPLDPALADVVYTTGFLFNGDGTADIYGSINDAGEGRIRVNADFLLQP